MSAPPAYEWDEQKLQREWTMYSAEERDVYRRELLRAKARGEAEPLEAASKAANAVCAYRRTRGLADFIERKPLNISPAPFQDARETIHSQRERVYRHLLHSGAATCKALEDALGIPSQAVSARVHELVQAGRVADSGRTEATAIVWRVNAT